MVAVRKDPLTKLATDTMPRPFQVRGDPFPKAQRVDYDYDPGRGFLNRYHYEGISQQILINLQNDYVRAGIACRLSLYKGLGDLEVEDSSQQFTLDSWQLLGNDYQLDLFYHPTIVGNLTPGQIAAARTHLNNNADPAVAFAVSSDPLIADLSGFAGTVIQRFYEKFQRGVTAYESDQDGSGYVLRHTTNAPGRWQSNIADFGVGKIYTPAQLLTEVQDSSLWILPIPGRLAYKISNIPSPTPVANELWGWRKSRSTETLSANNRIEINTEYTLGQCDTDIYEPY